MTVLLAPAARGRRAWLGATVMLTALPIGLAVVLAPAADAPAGPALTWLLFVGSSVHVGATGWFYAIGEVRAHMRRHPGRYFRAPVALVVGAAVLAAFLPEHVLTWLLIGYFAWQFLHFQKQNLGLAALAARSCGAGPLTRGQRLALVAAGVGGVLGLAGHPQLLQLDTGTSDLLFQTGRVVLVLAVLAGAACWFGSRAVPRTAAATVVYLVSLLFFVPVFCFHSPYAAVAGLTIAHGLQYLLLVGMLAAAPRSGTRTTVELAVLVNVALVLGFALNRASHLHGSGPLGQAVFGAYLGLVMAHFVVDAGLWRMRDEFPRAFLAGRLPFLMAPARI